jgi:hypothetical protein
MKIMAAKGQDKCLNRRQRPNPKLEEEFETRRICQMAISGLKKKGASLTLRHGPRIMMTIDVPFTLKFGSVEYST